MKKRFTLIIFHLLGSILAVAQNKQIIDSLKHEIEITQNDTLKLVCLLRIAEAFDEPKPDSAYYYANQELRLARKLNIRLNEALALNGIAYALKNMGNYPASLQTYLSANEILMDASIEETMLPTRYYHYSGLKQPTTRPMIRTQILGFNQLGLGLLYETINNYNMALLYDLQAKRSFDEVGNANRSSFMNMILGRTYLALNKLDSALIFEKAAYDISIQRNLDGGLPSILLNLGRTYLEMGNRKLAAEYFRKAVKKSIQYEYLRGQIAADLLLYDVYQQQGKKDSSAYFVNEALRIARYQNAPDLLLRTYTALAAFYSSSGNSDSTVKYQSLIITIKDNLFGTKQAQQFQAIDMDYKQRQLEIEAAEKNYRDRLKIYGMLAGLAMLLVVAIILWRSNRHRQQAYLLLQKQKQETDFQKEKVERTLEELKSAQTLLIQSEKMASLGELTAGIAHEIQNPLNFVNNFSEVNKELLAEMKEEIEKGNFEEAKSLASNVISNQEKINQHGKRADGIVRGMLQHSRSSSGTKEPTDVNALAEEHLKLAYHAQRAKDKTFNVKLETDFDESIGKVNVAPQEIGRVILNLITNAFYAVSEKKKQSTAHYDPTVKLRTKRKNDHILISVIDNGNGIPSQVLDKIFQPFFTTKPTGQGTGLGLSLSYDIVKAHGGELKVDTKKDEGSEFVVGLPVS